MNNSVQCAFSIAWNETLAISSLSSQQNVSTIIVSTLMLFPSDSCSLQISFNLQSDSPVEVFLNSSEVGLVPINVTSDLCHYGVFTDRTILNSLLSFRLILFSADLFVNDVIYGSVTSHRCVEFESIKVFPFIYENPSFVTVSGAKQSLCSLEVESEDIICDWFNVIGISNERFEWTDVHSCITNGVSKTNRDQDINFLSLQTDHSNSSDYIISPIVERSTSHSRISFWYFAKCSGSSIRVFVVPTHYDVNGIRTGDILPVFERPLVEVEFDWTYQVLEIPIPSMHSSYHVSSVVITIK